MGVKTHRIIPGAAKKAAVRQRITQKKRERERDDDGRDAIRGKGLDAQPQQRWLGASDALERTEIPMDTVGFVGFTLFSTLPVDDR